MIQHRETSVSVETKTKRMMLF